MKTTVGSQKKRYFLLILVLIINLIVISSRMSSLPWYVEGGWGTIGLLVMTPVFVLFAYVFSKNDLKYSKNQTKLLIPIIGVVINGLNLLLTTSELQTDISLLIMMLLIITAFQVSFPLKLSYRV